MTALLIAPDRLLADSFLASVAENRCFQILAEIRNYPSLQTLDIRLRQLRPDVVLIDLYSNLDSGCELIRFLAGVRPPVHIVGLHVKKDSEAVLRSLRLGAGEFLHAPFDTEMQREAVARLRRLRQPEQDVQPEMGKVIAFTSAKPGSGASTLATQTAFAVKRTTGRPVLLIDFDLTGGIIGFSLKINHNYSVLDALAEAEHMDPALWSKLTASVAGIDVLPAPETPYCGGVEPMRLHNVLEYSRLLYEWVLIDLPVAFQPLALQAISEAEEAFLVSTSELASLHMVRKSINLLEQIGINKDRYRLVINRVNRKENISAPDLEKIFNRPIFTMLPNDYSSLHRVVTLGQPLGLDSDLGKAIAGLAGRIAGQGSPAARRGSGDPRSASSRN